MGRRGLLLLFALGACSSEQQHELPQLPRAPSPRFDEVWGTATHNAYWVDRGVKDDTFASGVGERILDQLIFDRARSIELDVHRDDRVYHTVPGNGLCDTLRDCLAEVRLFHRALPKHEPLTIVLELKELFEPNFDDKRTPEALDQLLREELGEALYSPRELLSRCPGDETLTACVKRAGWPSIDDLRGRVQVALLGNWDELGHAQATVDWAHYAGRARDRVAFPMASSWKLDISTFQPRVAELTTQAELDRARAQSVFLQVEDLADANADPFLAMGGIVRVGSANSVDDQRIRVARRMHLLQTDTPWIRLNDPPPDVALFTFQGVARKEPGERYLVPAGAFGSFARTGLGEFEAIVVTGHDKSAVGCLRASGAARFEVCRRKTADEHVVISAELCDEAMKCTKNEVQSIEPAPGGVGDLLGWTESARAGMTCYQARAARGVDRDLAPRWVNVGDALCTATALPQVGAAGAGLIVAPRWNGAPVELPGLVDLRVP